MASMLAIINTTAAAAAMAIPLIAPLPRKKQTNKKTLLNIMIILLYIHEHSHASLTYDCASSVSLTSSSVGSPTVDVLIVTLVVLSLIPISACISQRSISIINALMLDLVTYMYLINNPQLVYYSIILTNCLKSYIIHFW